MSPDDLIIYLDSFCRLDLPESTETAEDLKKISDFLTKSASLYTYISNLELLARVRKKKLKSEKAEKGLIDCEAEYASGT